MKPIDGMRPMGTPSVPTLPAQPSSPREEGSSPFTALLKGLSTEVAHGEQAVRGAEQAARAGIDLGTPELISLQCEVYRYNTVIDLTSKLVDHATTAVKTVVQSGQS